MVIVGLKIQSKLQTLVEQYVDYRTEQEYGISAFWYWYYQVTKMLRRKQSTIITEVINSYLRENLLPV